MEINDKFQLLKKFPVVVNGCSINKSNKQDDMEKLLYLKSFIFKYLNIKKKKYKSENIRKVKPGVPFSAINCA